MLHVGSYSPLESKPLGQTHSQVGSSRDKFFAWMATCCGGPRQEALDFCQGSLLLLLSQGMAS